MMNWCLCIQTLCVALIVLVNLPVNVECLIFEDIDTLSSLFSTDVPVPTTSQNEKLRQIILSYSSTPPPAFDNPQLDVPQPSSPHIHESQPQLHYPIAPSLPSIPHDVEVFDPASYPGAKPDVDRYPSTPKPQPPVFRPSYGGSLPPFSVYNDVETYDPNMNVPISVDDIEGLFDDAVLSESPDGTRKQEEVDSKGGSGTNVEQFEESQDTLKDINCVNSTKEDDDPMTPVINKIKSIVFDQLNATFPQIHKENEVKLTQDFQPDSAVNTQENDDGRIITVDPPKPKRKPSTTPKPCNPLFDLFDQLMKIENNKKPGSIPPEGAIPSYATYYAQPLGEFGSDSEISLPMADYMYSDYVEVPIVYAFN